MKTKELVQHEERNAATAEKAIGERLMRSRQESRWSQGELADVMKVSRDIVANYESGRTPICYGSADAACEKLNISQRWLATGEGFAKGYVPLAESLRKTLAISSKAKFSEVYAVSLQDICGRAVERLNRKKIAVAVFMQGAKVMGNDGKELSVPAMIEAGAQRMDALKNRLIASVPPLLLADAIAELEDCAARYAGRIAG